MVCWFLTGDSERLVFYKYGDDFDLLGFDFGFGWVLGILFGIECR